MAPIGYIVQYSNEDDYTVYHGFVKLHKHFSQALEHAQELYRSYLEIHTDQFDGPFEAFKPTKKDCDSAGSVIVFQSRDYIVWIDCVVE